MTKHHLKFLSLKGGFAGSSESALVEMAHCWKSHDAAHYNYLSPAVQVAAAGSLLGLCLLLGPGFVI